MGYKNAPDLEPRIGDRVYCGLPGDTEVVIKISKNKKEPMISNCTFADGLHLNYEQEAQIHTDVDGRTYERVRE